jgi:adenylate kinase
VFFLLGGVPGVGKTSIIREVVALGYRRGLPIIGMCEKEVLCTLTGTVSPEEYDRLPDEARARARREMVSLFYQEDRERPEFIRVRDDHFTVPREDGSYFIRPVEPGDPVQILAMAVLTAPPKVIAARRARDAAARSGGRSGGDCGAISTHQRLEIETACAQAESLGVPCAIVSNDEGQASAAAHQLLSVIEQVYRG